MIKFHKSYLKRLEEIQGKGCGDFNARNWLWGSTKIACNGETVEQFIDDRSLVCLITGERTRYNITANTTSNIDLTMISNEMAEMCEWYVIDDNTIGSDHFPIICTIRVNKYKTDYYLQRKCLYEKADWKSF